MADDYILELFRQLHEAEEERHQRLTANIGLPTAVVTVLCGVLAFYLDKFNGPPKDALQVVFVVFMGGFGLSIAAAIVCIILALVHYSHRFLSDATDIHEYKRNMESWYLDIGSDKVHEKVVDDLQELMIEQYRDCAITNRQSNGRRSKYLHFAKLAVVVALIFLAASLYPFYKSVKRLETIYKVQIVEKQTEPTDGGKTTRK